MLYPWIYILNLIGVGRISTNRYESAEACVFKDATGGCVSCIVPEEVLELKIRRSLVCVRSRTRLRVVIAPQAHLFG